MREFWLFKGNASDRKRQDIVEQIEQALPNIRLCFLPPYPSFITLGREYLK